MRLQIAYTPSDTGWVGRRHELIAAAVNRNDITRFLGIVFQFLPQLRHVYIDGPGIRNGLIAPHLVQQLLPGDGRLPVGDQIAEKLELPSGKLDWLAFSRHFLAAKIDGQVLETEYGI